MQLKKIIRTLLLSLSVFLFGVFFFCFSAKSALAANYTFTVSNYHLDTLTHAITFTAASPNPLFDDTDRTDVVVTSAPYDIIDSAVLYRSNWPNNPHCNFGTPQEYSGDGYYCNNDVLSTVNPNQQGGLYICIYSEFDNNIYCSQEINSLDLFANVSQATMDVSNYHLDTSTNQITFTSSNPNPLFDDTDRIDIFVTNSPITADPLAISPTDSLYSSYWPNNPNCTYGQPGNNNNTGFYCNNEVLHPINNTPANTVYLCLYSEFNTRMYCSQAISYADLTVVPPTLILAINSGGGAQGNFVADTDNSGGQSYSSSAPVDTSSVSNPAPQATYQSVRYGNNFTYTIPNLTANAAYTTRLHFNELYWGTSLSGNNGGIGSRVFNVAINGTQVLHNFDIYAAAGGSNIALVQQFPTTADSNGNIHINFSTVTDNAMINGLEIYSGTLPTPTPTPTPTPASSVAINPGGTTVGSFLSDRDYTGGTSYTSSAPVDTTHVSNPADESVYQSVRYGNFTYTIPNLFPSSNYNVKLHFNELYWGTALAGNNGGIGSRVFNVAINGTNVLSNYDIFQDAGGANIATVKQFSTTSDANGKITITFTTVTDNAMVNGIEVSQ